MTLQDVVGDSIDNKRYIILSCPLREDLKGNEDIVLATFATKEEVEEWRARQSSLEVYCYDRKNYWGEVTL